MTIYLEDFANYLTAIKGRSARTVKEYKYDISQFLRYAKERRELDGNELVKAITVPDIHAYLSHLTMENVSASTRARKICALRSFYKYLTRIVEVLDKNVMDKIEAPKVKRTLPVSLSLIDSLELIKSFNSNPDDFYRFRDKCIVTMFLNCGLRLSELSSLKTDMVQSDRIVIIGKGDKERTVYLNQASRTALTVWLDIRKSYNSPFLFVTKKNKQLKNSSIQAMVKKSLVAIGLDPAKYSVHKLRHTAATLMYQYGNVDVLVLQKFLGHASVSTTQIYTHVSDKQLQAASQSNPLSAA